VSSNKKSFVLRLNAETYEALEKWAEDEFRSVNGQLEWLIDQQLRKAGRYPKRKRDPNQRPPDQENRKEEC